MKHDLMYLPDIYDRLVEPRGIPHAFRAWRFIKRDYPLGLVVVAERDHGRYAVLTGNDTVASLFALRAASIELATGEIAVEPGPTTIKITTLLNTQVYLRETRERESIRQVLGFADQWSATLRHYKVPVAIISRDDELDFIEQVVG